MKSFLASLGMFTKIKVKDNVFVDSKGPDILCFFAFDGFICGAFSAAVYFALSFFGVRSILAAAVMLFSLFFVSGFLHLDGFMDCADSLLSSRDREGKIRILKDSTVGAFAVISVCLLMILLWSSMETLFSACADLHMFMTVPFVSRAMFSVILFTFRPLENNKGLLYYFGSGKKPVHVFIVMTEAAAGLIAMYAVSPVLALSGLIAMAVSFIAAKAVEKTLDGINGDVIGGGVIVTEALTYLIYAILL